MSKMDALRAMREAKYAAAQTRSGTSPTTASAPVAGPAKSATTAKAKPVRSAAKPKPAQASAEACGHRNMSGRSCTRPQGHSEKSHRYS